MKKILLTLCFMIAVTFANAQTFNDTVLTYNLNSTPVNGIKIKTNLPFTDGSQMPTIIMEGYNYGSTGTTGSIGLILNWYIYDNGFFNAGISSFGSYTPPVYLANEGGKVVIFINSRDYYLRMAVRAFGKERVAETPANYQGWKTADEALTGTSQLLVPYRNRLAGDVYLQNGIWDKNGNVAIGTTTPGPYKLTVEGIIGARRVKVMQGTWADFVFEPEYKLPSLAEVEEYIKVNRHLPNVPSAKEVEKEGLDVGEMNKRLLQKVEELTLYLIEMNNHNKKLEKRVSELEQETIKRKED
jgi:hypothetical protein